MEESHDHNNVCSTPTHYIVWTGSSKFASSEALNEPFGGLVWPPKAYTCSFCRRDFRSAQALGGHMNVHRRDRARINRYPPPRQPERDDNNVGGSRGSCTKKRWYIKKTGKRTSFKEKDIDLELRLGVSPLEKGSEAYHIFL